MIVLSQQTDINKKRHVQKVFVYSSTFEIQLFRSAHPNPYVSFRVHVRSC